MFAAFGILAPVVFIFCNETRQANLVIPVHVKRFVQPILKPTVPLTPWFACTTFPCL